jgi:hypothetical protein
MPEAYPAAQVRHLSGPSAEQVAHGREHFRHLYWEKKYPLLQEMQKVAFRHSVQFVGH